MNKLRKELARILRRQFFSRESTIVAKDLIGKVLVRNLGNQNLLKGLIVEVEAYGGLKDPASHAYRGRTSRNEAMFGEAGYTYVYFTYGFYYCLNIVTGKIGNAQAVLIRSLEPIEGLEIMRKNRSLRGKISDTNIASGPGKICQALQIDRSLDKMDVTMNDSPIFIEAPLKNNTTKKLARRRIVAGPRIGITSAVERKWRFYDATSLYVSHRSKVNLPRIEHLANSRP